MAHVLVVEGEDDIRELVQRGLARAGHAVDAARNGSQAMGLVERGVYDVVVLNVGTPRAAGFELAGRIKRGSRGGEPRILMVSAFASLADQRRGLESGADDYLVKPSPVDEIVEAVAELAGPARSSLEQSLTGLQQVDELHEDFLLTVSHELRTPLTSIIGFTDLLAREAFGPVNAQQAELLERIDRGARRLTALVETVLSASRGEPAQEKESSDPMRSSSTSVSKGLTT